MTEAREAFFDGHEQVVLSAYMNGSPCLPEVTGDDFSSPPNRVIYNRIIGLTNRNIIAVTDALRKAGELDKAGGPHRITEISLMPHHFLLSASPQFVTNGNLNSTVECWICGICAATSRIGPNCADESSLAFMSSSSWTLFTNFYSDAMKTKRATLRV